MKKELNFKSKQLKSKQLKYLIEILTAGGGDSRLIGGCVRDALLGKQADDIDIATTLVPDDVMALLQKHNILVVPTGIKHGTVTAIFEGEKFEITTLRKDLHCDGRWATVEYTNDFEQDALRRDFTINALSYCIFRQQVFDYFSGLEHLRQRRVVFIQDPAARILEDHLRILRFFRFSAYYAQSFDEQGLVACNTHAAMLANLAKERINAEVDKILLAPRCIDILKVMEPCVLKIIFPSLKLSIEILASALQYQQLLGVVLSLPSIYAILFSSNENIGFENFRFSNARRKQILSKLKFINQGKNNIDLNLKKLWLVNANIEQFLILAVTFGYLELDSAIEFKRYFASVVPPKLPINGDVLRNLGYAGKDIGNMLNYLQNIWIQKNFNITEEELIKCLNQRG